MRRRTGLTGTEARDQKSGFRLLISVLLVSGFFFLISASQARADQFNSADGVNYSGTDSAFRLYGDPTADVMKFQCAVSGVAGNPITWVDGPILNTACSISSVGVGRYALTDGATVAVDWNNGNTQSVTLGGNRTFTFANPQDGARYTLIIKQDGTGSRTATWPATVRWPGGTAPTLTATASKTDYVGFIYNGVDSKYDGVAISQNY